TTNESVTVQSGGTLTVSDNIEIDAEVTIESGGTMSWPSTIEIGANANITVNGNISAGSTTIVYQDDYAGTDKGKITATGTMKFSRVKSSSSVKGGSLQASSITIETYGENEVGVDMAFHGPTTIATYMGYGYTYFTNGDLTITNYNNSNNNSSVPLNEIVSLNGDLKFTNKVTTKNSSLQTNIDGDIYFNNGFENAYKGTPDTRLIAHNIYITNELKGEGDTNTYLEANVIQTGTLAINQNSHGNIYIKNDFDSNTFGTTFNNTNATFKIEGNSHFDNISGHLNASASLITLGDSYMGGSGTFGANDGPLYVGGQLVIDKVQVSFQGSAYGYIGNVYEASEFIDKGMYNGLYDGDTQVGGTGNHPRDADNNPNENEGKYISIGGGQITSASMIKDLSEAETAGLNITPESWSTPLPIELVEFYADVTEHNYVEVFWTTATETNNDYFTLYRSNNGITFNPIAEIAGAGTTVYQTTYSYLDASFYTGTSYYKFSQTDYDGSVHFSKTIAVYIKPNSVTYLFLSDKIHVSFADSVQSHHVMISSVDGRILFSKGFHNTTQTEIPMPHETGLFIISTLSSKGIVNQKFVR
ncbi:MAG TPA: polymer-forming cytoskeletal protein, partial [Bacteroidales bacterium]|nr:polymer-forming cytoskeletal protein [Bacteroidales bacterium]